MAVVDIFSKRSKPLQTADADVYQYDTLPRPFRVQVCHILNNAIGPWVDNSQYYTQVGGPEYSNKCWKLICETMRREKGLFSLTQREMIPVYECLNYLMEAGTEDTLDIIEFSFRVVDRFVRELHPIQMEEARITEDPDNAITELNQRFREHRIGYEYVKGQIIRIDSSFLHAETVRPALELLAGARFPGASEEFMRGFEHFRHGRNKEAVAEALKAFESTMKGICAARKWPFSPKASAKDLLDLLFKNGLIPSDLQSHFSAFRSALESGLPTLRNRTSGHGQGPQPKPLPGHFASYALHLAAANIVFLMEAHNAG